MPLTTRRPTGKLATPIILVHGRAKSGVTSTALKLSASDNVGRTFVFELGGTVADQYQELGPYEIVELDGTWASFHSQLIGAVNEPRPENGNRNVIIVDVIGAIWNDLGLWVEKRSRSSAAARERLAKDPNASIDTSGYWTDAKGRWGAMIRLLQDWDGIVVLCAHGDDVAVYENGQPVPGAMSYKINAEKGTQSAAGYIVHTVAGAAPLLTAAALPTLDIGSGIELDSDNPLDQLVTGIIDLTSDTPIEPRKPYGATVGVKWTASDAKSWVVALFTAGGYSEDDAKVAASEVWDTIFPGKPILFELTDADIDDIRTTVEIMVNTPPAPEPAAPAAEPAVAAEPEPAAEPAPEVPAGEAAVDQVAVAQAFVAAHGGDPDGPSTDPEYDDSPFT